MKRVNIANLCIEIDTADQRFLNEDCAPYENGSGEKPDMRLKTRHLETIDKPRGEILEAFRAATILRMGEAGYCRILTSGRTGQNIVAVFYDDAYSEVRIDLLKGFTQPELFDQYEYLYCGEAFRDRLTTLGGAVIHGSALAYKNQGIIFSADCGVGKSTQTGLWQACFGNEVTIVNDDKPAIRFYEGIPYMFGTPWCGKDHLSTNMQTRLNAIIFLEQADVNRMERLNTRESIFSLMRQIVRPFYDESLGRKTMDVIKELVTAVPIYKLQCTASLEAVEAAYQKLIRENVIKP